MIRALYVKCQLGEMMKMIKGHRSETETYMLVRGLKWADSGEDGGAAGGTAHERENK